MAIVIPNKPSSFTPQGVAPGCRRIPNLYERGLTGRPIDILCVHTNWAGGVGTIESAINWASSAPGSHTYPHYQHDLDGDAAKLLDTNRRGIGNAGLPSYWRDTYGLPDASYRALVFETADKGTNAEPAPTGSYFTEQQIASLARDLAYECIVHNIPPVLLPKPDGRGITGHCWPFPYPAFTTASGKQCPGYRKRQQLVDVIIPYVQAIVADWTHVEPPPPPPDYIVALEPFGTFEIHEGGRWPTSVARAIYGNPDLWERVVNFNGPEITIDNWEKVWPGVGGKVRVPGWSDTGAISGVRVKVPRGVGAAKVIQLAYPELDTWAKQAAELPEFDKWNGGNHDVREGEVVFVRHPGQTP